MGAFEKFYRNLFAENKTNRKNIEARELLEHSVDKLSDSNREFLGACPNLKELEATLKKMPPKHSLGSDGITLEVLKSCWSFIRKDVLAMILCFWEMGVMAHKILHGIIKLIPKSTSKQLVIDWHLTPLLNAIYKLISKLLAIKLNSLLPDLIRE